QGDRRATVALANVQDKAPQPLAVHVTLAGNLLGGWQDRLDLAQINENGPRILPLLDHARDDVALAARVLAEGQLVLGVPQPLQDDLPGGGRGDPAETGGR